MEKKVAKCHHMVKQVPNKKKNVTKSPPHGMIVYPHGKKKVPIRMKT